MRGFPLSVDSIVPRTVPSPPTHRSPSDAVEEREGWVDGGGQRRKAGRASPLYHRLYPGQRAIALFGERKTKDKLREQRNRASFFPFFRPFQLNSHRYTAPECSRYTYLRMESLFRRQPCIFELNVVVQNSRPARQRRTRSAC